MGNAVMLSLFTRLLSQRLDRTVVDKTNLDGRFDIQLYWLPMSERWRWTLVEIRCRQLILAVRPSSLPFKSNSDLYWKQPRDLST